MAKARGRWIAVGASALGVVVISATVAVLWDSGRDWWHLRKLAGGTPEERVRAADWLAARRCAAAVPPLVRELVAGSSTVPSLPGSTPPRPPSEEWWEACWPGEALVAIGEPAVDALADLLADDDPGAHEAAMEVLHRIGLPAVPRLAARVYEGDLRELAVKGRVRGMWVLGRFGSKAREALEPALRGLDHPAGTVRFISVQQLESLGPEASPAVPRLIAGLEREEVRIRWRMVHALRRIGPAAAVAGPALVREFERASAQAVGTKAGERPRNADRLHPGYLGDVFGVLDAIWPQGLREAYELAPEGLRAELLRRGAAATGRRAPSPAFLALCRDVAETGPAEVREAARRLLDRAAERR